LNQNSAQPRTPHMKTPPEGIVLLLLYLALDEADDRSLIIDQPEENLDPKEPLKNQPLFA
jgi:hypothetical protein